jgi:hypothetical protein
MSGGSDDSDTTASTNASVMVPVPQTTFDLSRAQNAGVQPTAQTGTLAAKPAWMTGGWDNAAWGKDAATGQPLTQESMNALLTKGYTPATAAAPVAETQQAPAYTQDRSIYMNANQGNGGVTLGDAAYSEGSQSKTINPSEFYRQLFLATEGKDIAQGDAKTAQNKNLLQLW